MRRGSAGVTGPVWFRAMVALAVGATAPAGAAEGFAVNRFEPSERGSDWFTLDSLEYEGRGRWAMGVVGDWAHRPLVLYDDAGDEFQAPLRDQLYAYLGGSVFVFDRLRIAADLPLLLVNDGDTAPPGVTGIPVTRGSNVGDLRVAADVRVLGDPEDALALAVGARVYAPTGKVEAFSGDGAWRFEPHIAGAGRIGPFEYALRTAFDLRPRSTFVGARLGSEWSLAFAAGARVWHDRLLIGPEVWAATLVNGSTAAFDADATPVEALLGAHYQSSSSWRFGLGAGPGLSPGLGTPEGRVVASLQWIEEERAPEQPAVAPPPVAPVVTAPKDSDADGVLDAADACPQDPGNVSEDTARNGCPELDGDGDGILDREDACASEAGSPSLERARHGCPAPVDGDADGIIDESDACPALPGVSDPDPTRSGCPVPRDFDAELLALGGIEFENRQAMISPTSNTVLEGIATLLEQHPELRQVSIVGHTDDRGDRAHNLELSRRRAEAVRDWLVGRGIAAARLSARGMGPDQPLESNDTAAGRRKNRRVELRVSDSASSR